MPLIFAIDSDKRQSAQLASLLRAHVDADLVQSGSAVEGLNILQGRVPDLILTASLLSPRDETALANHLRDLGVRAAHVQTLTIPVLAGAQVAGGKKSKGGGVLAALRREKKTVKPSGCDPEVFAQEVQMYLDRALEQREALRALLPPDTPVTVAPEAAEALVAATSAQAESGIEPPTIVMLAPTVLAVVVKSQPAAEPGPSAADVETPQHLGPEPVVLDGPVVLDEPVVVDDPVVANDPVVVDAPVVLASEPVDVPVLAVPPARQAEPQVFHAEPTVFLLEPVEPQAVAAPPHVVAAPEEPVLLATVALPEPVEEPVQQPAVIASADVIAVEPVPDTWSDRLPEPVTAPAPPEAAFDRSWAFAAIPPPPAPEELPPPVLEDVAPDVVAPDPQEQDLTAADLPATELLGAEAAQAADEVTPLELPAVEALSAAPQPAVLDGPTMEPPAGSPLVSLEAEEFDALLAPPPTRIADAIRMPEPPVPTVDMVAFHDLEALAEDFAAAGLTADVSAGGSVVEAAGEGAPTSALGENSVTAIEAASETMPAPVAAAAPEVVTAAPEVEVVTPGVAVEETPVVEPAPIIEAVPAAAMPVIEVQSIADAQPAMEAVCVQEPAADEPEAEATPVETVPLKAETVAPIVAAIAAAPADAKPMVPEAPPAELPVEAPALKWSWLEGDGAPLADLLAAEAFSFTPAAVEAPPAALEADVEAAVGPVPEPQIEDPDPVTVAEPVADEVFDPDASASWNLVASAPALDVRDVPADGPAAPIVVEAELPDPAADSVQVATEPGTWDPLSAAAWQAAVVSAPDTPATAERAPVVAVAPPEPEAGPEAAAAPVPDPDAPTLDPEVLAILGLAAHQAGLDALESLDAEPEPDPASRASASDGSGRKRPRMDRGRQKTSARRDKRAARPAPRKSPRPAQDEWGMFDPAQCGPDALFDSDEWRVDVDEDEDDEDDRRRPPRPRAFGY
jgi:hypothetical protein